MPPLYLLLFLFLGIFLVTVIQLQLLSIAFEKLGMSPQGALLLMLGILLGSGINIPVARIATPADMPADLPLPRRGLLWPPPDLSRTGYTIIAVNLGGCLIPVAVALYLLFRQLVSPADLLPALLVITTVSYLFSRPVPGIGIAMPFLLAPLVTVATALILAPESPAPLAFSSGVLGVLLGADILHLREIRRMGVRIASIGGAGTFDGVFLTGIIAVLLA
jgi:uncharacterized membrane protein